MPIHQQLHNFLLLLLHRTPLAIIVILITIITIVTIIVITATTSKVTTTTGHILHTIVAATTVATKQKILPSST